MCNENMVFSPLSVYCRLFCVLPGLYYSTSVSSLVLQLQFELLLPMFNIPMFPCLPHSKTLLPYSLLLPVTLLSSEALVDAD